MLDPAENRRLYLTTWFVPDALTTIPFDWILIGSGQPTLGGGLDLMAKVPQLSAAKCRRVPPSASECRRVPPSAAECRRVPPSAAHRAPLSSTAGCPLATGAAAHAHLPADQARQSPRLRATASHHDAHGESLAAARRCSPPLAAAPHCLRRQEPSLPQPSAP